MKERERAEYVSKTPKLDRWRDRKAAHAASVMSKWRSSRFRNLDQLVVESRTDKLARQM
jgi:hypothetical protein